MMTSHDRETTPPTITRSGRPILRALVERCGDFILRFPAVLDDADGSLFSDALWSPSDDATGDADAGADE